MKKILLLLFCSSLVYSCQLNEIKDYESKPSITIDTLNIEQIKIKTH